MLPSDVHDTRRGKHDPRDKERRDRPRKKQGRARSRDERTRGRKRFDSTLGYPGEGPTHSSTPPGFERCNNKHGRGYRHYHNHKFLAAQRRLAEATAKAKAAEEKKRGEEPKMRFPAPCPLNGDITADNPKGIFCPVYLDYGTVHYHQVGHKGSVSFDAYECKRLLDEQLQAQKEREQGIADAQAEMEEDEQESLTNTTPAMGVAPQDTPPRAASVTSSKQVLLPPAPVAAKSGLAAPTPTVEKKKETKASTKAVVEVKDKPAIVAPPPTPVVDAKAADHRVAVESKVVVSPVVAALNSDVVTLPQLDEDEVDYVWDLIPPLHIGIPPPPPFRLDFLVDSEGHVEVKIDDSSKPTTPGIPTSSVSDEKSVFDTPADHKVVDTKGDGNTPVSVASGGQASPVADQKSTPVDTTTGDEKGDGLKTLQAAPGNWVTADGKVNVPLDDIEEKEDEKIVEEKTPKTRFLSRADLKRGGSTQDAAPQGGRPCLPAVVRSHYGIPHFTDHFQYQNRHLFYAAEEEVKKFSASVFGKGKGKPPRYTLADVFSLEEEELFCCDSKSHQSQDGFMKQMRYKCGLRWSTHWLFIIPNPCVRTVNVRNGGVAQRGTYTAKLARTIGTLSYGAPSLSVPNESHKYGDLFTRLGFDAVVKCSYSPFLVNLFNTEPFRTVSVYNTKSAVNHTCVGQYDKIFRTHYPSLYRLVQIASVTTPTIYDASLLKVLNMEIVCAGASYCTVASLSADGINFHSGSLVTPGRGTHTRFSGAFKCIEGHKYWKDGLLNFTDLPCKPQSYKTVFGPAFPHDGVVYANTARNLRYGMMRLTNERAIDKPGYHMWLCDNQRDNYKGHPFWKQLQGMFAEMDDFDHFERIEVEYSWPHNKKDLRVKTRNEIGDTGAIANRHWITKSVVFKMKCNEIARMNKIPRVVADLTCAGSLQGFVLTGRMKEQIANVDIPYKNGHIRFQLTPEPSQLDEVFRKLIHPPGDFYFVCFSDDSCIAVRTKDRLYTYNLDISSCDASHRESVFEQLFECTPEAHKESMRILIEQCQKTIRVTNPQDPNEWVKLKPLILCLFSGSTLTTLINTCVCMRLCCAIIDHGDYTPKGIADAAASVGYILTCAECTRPEDLQFLKHSPHEIDGEWYALMNLGVILRASGACQNDVPGSGDMRTRCKNFQYSLVTGAYPRSHFPLRDALAGQGQKIDLKGFWDYKVVDSGEHRHFTHESIARRYRIDPTELDEIADLVGDGFGMQISTPAVGRILEVDYALTTSDEQSTAEYDWSTCDTTQSLSTPDY